MRHTSRSGSPSATHRLVLATLGFALCGLWGCEDEAPRGGSNQVAVNACAAACDTQTEACPTADVSACTALCAAYGITIDAGTGCETAFLAWQACEEARTYSCSTFGGTTYAVPDDLDACDSERLARERACE